MVTSTPKLNLSKPAVGADDDLWGGYWNDNADVLDNLAPLNSPALVGTPTAPTPVSTDNTTKLATTAFVKTAIGSVPGGAVISATAPSLNPGALWWDSLGGQLYVRYDDGNSAQWTAASSLQGQAGVATTSYVDSAVAASSNVASHNVGRNLIHNGLFTVAQRGVGPFTVATGSPYTLDRWQINAAVADTINFSQAPIGDPGRVQIGDEQAQFALTNFNFVGNAAATSYQTIMQKIEGVRRLSGKTVIVSFWAQVSGTATKIGINIFQNMGTGGTPSPNNWVAATGTAITLAAPMARYFATFTISSISGLTLGTANNDYHQLSFWYSSGANNNATAGNIGVQSGTVNIWGVQLEIAAPGQTAPTPLEKMDAQQTLAVCQRFYCIGSFQIGGACTSGWTQQTPVVFPVTMRSSTVTVTPSVVGGSGYASPSAGTIHAGGFTLSVVPSAASYAAAASYTASADL